MKIQKRRRRLSIRHFILLLVVISFASLLQLVPFSTLVTYSTIYDSTSEVLLHSQCQFPKKSVFIFQPSSPYPRDDPNPVAARRRDLIAQAVATAWQGQRGQEDDLMGWPGTLFVSGRGEEYAFARDWVTRGSVSNAGQVEALLSAYQLTGDKLFLKLTKPAARKVGHHILAASKDASLTELTEILTALRALLKYSSNALFHRLYCRLLSQLDEKLQEPLQLILSLAPGADINSSSVSKHFDDLDEIQGLEKLQIFHEDGREFYEGLLQLWLLNGKCDSRLTQALVVSLVKLLRPLIQDTGGHDVYLKQVNSDGPNKIIIHQSMCYLVKMIHYVNPHLSTAVQSEWEDLATDIAKSCLDLYARSPNGLGGDRMELVDREWITSGAYDLRPDVAEMLFHAWRATGDETYREAAWQIFVKIEKYCRTSEGLYLPLKRDGDRATQDTVRKIPSWFIGTTLKYLFLTFSNQTVLPLDEWKFTRRGDSLAVLPEAHTKCTGRHFL